MGTYKYQGRITINNSPIYWYSDDIYGADTYIYKDWQDVGVGKGWKGTVCNKLTILVTSFM